ncbi:MAG: hypothetical protein IT477_10610 [Rhodanobacteraceae bacterium]|nr:hypothetical protein [Rhodanobacteraceae bacterium]
MSYDDDDDRPLFPYIGEEAAEDTDFPATKAALDQRAKECVEAGGAFDFSLNKCCRTWADGTPDCAVDPIEEKKRTADQRSNQRWIIGGAVAGVVVIGGVLYYIFRKPEPPALPERT